MVLIILIVFASIYVIFLLRAILINLCFLISLIVTACNRLRCSRCCRGSSLFRAVFGLGAIFFISGLSFVVSLIRFGAGLIRGFGLFGFFVIGLNGLIGGLICRCEMIIRVFVTAI